MLFYIASISIFLKYKRKKLINKRARTGSKLQKCWPALALSNPFEYLVIKCYTWVQLEGRSEILHSRLSSARPSFLLIGPGFEL